MKGIIRFELIFLVILLLLATSGCLKTEVQIQDYMTEDASFVLEGDCLKVVSSKTFSGIDIVIEGNIEEDSVDVSNEYFKIVSYDDNRTIISIVKISGEIQPNEKLTKISLDSSALEIIKIETKSELITTKRDEKYFRIENLSQPSLLGDFKKDNDVNLSDFILFVKKYGTQLGDADYEELYDIAKAYNLFNGEWADIWDTCEPDGIVNLSDFIIFAKNYGKSISNLPPEIPSNPNPQDAAENVSTNIELSWHCSDPNGDELKYDLYFGLDNATPTLLASNLSSNYYSPDTLATSTKYHWKVIAKDITALETKSPLWSFTTSATETSGYFQESFESGSLPENWTVGGNSIPHIVESEAFEGTYSLQFRNLDYNQISYAEVEINIPDNAYITFYRKVSSSIYYEYMRFYIDSNLVGKWSGEVDWGEAIREIPSGTHTLRWEFVGMSYSKDFSNFMGKTENPIEGSSTKFALSKDQNYIESSVENKCWLDNIQVLEYIDLGQEVLIPDANLNSAIHNLLGKTAEPVYSRELQDITEFNVYNKNISELTSIEYMSNLISLNLDENQIIDINPLDSLVNLNYLHLCNNQITDINPLINLVNLYKLDLDSNQIDNISPLSGLTSIYWLYLANNQLANIAPLSTLTNLNQLFLSENSISDITPLNGLSNLTQLYLNENSISDITPLNNLTNLNQLHLHRNQISNIDPLANLTSINYLYIYDNLIDDISSLANLNNLNHLYIQQNQITDVTSLANLVNIRYLYLNQNKIIDISSLESLINLGYLKLDNNEITDIQPLVDNPGISQGDNVVISNNYLDLSAGSDDMLNIYILESRGVNVDYEPQQ